jgi:hypothetical protein
MIVRVHGLHQPDLSSANRMEMLAGAEIFQLITSAQRSALLL